MSIAIILLSLSLMTEQVIELRFLEHITNSISDYLGGKTDDFTAMLIWPAIFLGLLLIMKITDSIYKIVVEKYESRVVFDSEKKIISKLSSISYENYETNEFYEKVNLARQASGQYSQAVYGITQLANILFMVVTYGVLLSQINMLYVLIIFVCIVVSVILASGTTEKQLDFWRVHVSPDERKCSYFKNTFANRVNHQNIQTNRAFSYFKGKYSFFNSHVRTNYLKLNFYSFSTELFTSIMFLGSYLFAALLVGNGVITGKFEIGYFSMVIALLSNMFVTVKKFAMFMLNKNWYIKVLDAYYSILGLPDEIRTTEKSLNALIEMENLTYKYAQAENNALNGITASFRNGCKIAVVGENGSGKSTMVSVILGLLQNYGGSFRCADVKITAILQDFIQYHITVRENIEIGAGGLTLPDEKIVEILKKVELYDYIMSKTDGINTRLGQLESDGVELSKGQWQRLAIARLLADENASVWVLDEPTSYLDPISEIEMYNFIFNLAEDRLVFFISHRLGFAKMADTIVVLDGGVIIEAGTHSELMSMPDGKYLQMFNLQREWYT